MFWKVFFIVIVVIIVIIIWVIFAKRSKLASALRSLFHGAKAKATNMLDDANNQMESAESEIDSKLARTRTGLIDVKIEVKSAKREVDNITDSIEQWKNGVTLAIKDKNRDLAGDCLTRQKEAETLLPELKDQYEKLVGQERTMKEAYDELERQKRIIGQKKSSIKARTIVAKSQQDINELLSGVTAGGQLDSVNRAMELVQKAEDKASSTGEVRTSFQKDQDLKNQLKNISNKDDIDAELDGLFEQYASANSGENVKPS